MPLDIDAALVNQDILMPAPPTPNRRSNEKRTGNTIYIFGYNITEDILRRAFQTFGNILSVTIEPEKNCGFITFDRPEAADQAISEMNGSMFADIHLKVSLARRQILVDLSATEPTAGDAAGSQSWPALSASPAVKSNHLDKRQLVAYDDIF
jgi:negative elongation factor E